MQETVQGASASQFEAWAILELMGHRRLGGFVREVQIAGAGFFRIDVPDEGMGCDGMCDPDAPGTCQRPEHRKIHSTQFYPPLSVYCLTPVSEAAARAVARSNRPQPVATWELPAPSRDGIPHNWAMCRNCGERHSPSEGCYDPDEADSPSLQEVL